MEKFEMSFQGLLDRTITLGDWLVLTPQIINWIIITSSTLIGIVLIIVIAAIIVKKKRKKIAEAESIVDEEVEKKAINKVKVTQRKSVSIHTTLRVVEIIGKIVIDGDRILLNANDGSTYNLYTIAPWESQDTLKDSENLRQNIGRNVEIIGDSDGNAIWKARVNKILNQDFD